jgi:hypothetical protein
MVVHKKGVKRAAKVQERSRKKVIKEREAGFRRYERQEEVAEAEAAAASKKK